MGRSLVNNNILATVTTIAVVTVVGRIVTSHMFPKKKETQPKSSSSPTSASPAHVLDVIAKRRSIFPKQYTDKLVDKAVVDKMLEAAKWAPTHHLTEPWEFIVMESMDAKQKLGHFLATSYKESCLASGKPFVQTKFEKKQTNVINASFVIGIVVIHGETNPLCEEIASVSMAVQNMLLVATSFGVGAYWSSGGVHDKAVLKQNDLLVANPKRLQDFLGWNETKEQGGIRKVCLGWIFVGDFYGNVDNAAAASASNKKKWPTSRRKPLSESNRVSWR